MAERKFKFGDKVSTSDRWSNYGPGTIEMCDPFCIPKGEYRYEVRLESGDLRYFFEGALSNA